MFFRGTVCAAIACFFGVVNGDQLKPKNVRLQLLRLVTTGFSLSAFTASYKYLSATSVSLISRTDLPLMILGGSFLQAKPRRKQQVLAGLALLLLGIGITNSPMTEPPLGFAFAFGGVLSLILGYSFLKSSSERENVSVVTITPAVASIVFGLTIGLTTSQELPKLDTLPVIAASGLGMFSMYRLSNLIYQRISTIEAQTPSIFLPILAMPIEVFGFGQNFSMEYALVVLGTVVLLATAQLARRKNHEREATTIYA
jgi:drug/metabolite transporter (DMT)-like permease